MRNYVNRTMKRDGSQTDVIEGGGVGFGGDGVVVGVGKRRIGVENGSVGGADIGVVGNGLERKSIIHGGVAEEKYLTISCWNYRGLSTAIPYVEKLLSGGMGVLVISEHWLWPYELNKLNNVSSEFCATGKSDSRLCPESDYKRGCGGIGIVWHKSIGANPVENIASDRICAIRFPFADLDSSLTVIGFYLPCLEQGIDLY